MTLTNITVLLKNSSYFIWDFNMTFSSFICFGTYGAIRLWNKSFNAMERAGGYVTEAISHGEHLVSLFIGSFLLYFVTFAAQVTLLCCAFTNSHQQNFFLP